jgi:phosphoribosylformylglycinamidine synthase
MAAPAVPGDAADLYAAVRAVGMELCPALGITIPVGKDSMSMSTVWQDGAEKKRMTAPVSLIVSAFAPVTDVRQTLTPALQRPASKRVEVESVGLSPNAGGSASTSTSNFNQEEDTVLLLIDLGRGKNRLGGSILAQVLSQTGDVAPDVDSPADLKNFWNAVQQLGREKKLLAYHDRSDGGLLACVAEMAFAGNTGVDLQLGRANSRDAVFAQLFSEELGAVVQIRRADLEAVTAILRAHSLHDATSEIGTLNHTHTFRITQGGETLAEENLFALRAVWSDVTRRMQLLRDNPACAEQEYQLKLDPQNRGISPKLTFTVQHFNTEATEVDQSVSASSATSVFKNRNSRPKVAILREQGVNSQNEMAAAFTRAGFSAIDVHMTDILSGRISLRDFRGVAACGGFSYGDVLGAGEGWAKSILFNPRARAEFEAFFAREDTFALGICNGCQMMSNLHSLIPGSGHWPRFVQNKSERFEARFCSLKIESSPSIFFRGMEGSVIPIVVSHGEGFTEFPNAEAASACNASGLVAARYVDNNHAATEHYPLNPNGSPFGITALTTTTGRVMIMMPHPERTHRTINMSWHPAEWLQSDDSPWMQLFHNARRWVG